MACRWFEVRRSPAAKAGAGLERSHGLAIGSRPRRAGGRKCGRVSREEAFLDLDAAQGVDASINPIRQPHGLRRCDSGVRSHGRVAQRPWTTAIVDATSTSQRPLARKRGIVVTPSWLDAYMSDDHERDEIERRRLAAERVNAERSRALEDGMRHMLGRSDPHERDAEEHAEERSP